MATNIINMNNVSKTYLKNSHVVKAVDNVDLSVKKGEFLGIMGMSGSGKTTLINLIAGFDTPTSGKIMVDGFDLSTFNDEQFSQFRNKKIGMVFQQFNLIREFNVLQNVIVPSIIANKDYSTIVEIARRLLYEQGLEARLFHYPDELSGGEQQRVGIARSLMNDPTIVLVDEPTANLDRKSAEKIAGMLEGMHNNGKTLIVISHDHNILKNANRVITMEYGQLIHSTK